MNKPVEEDTDDRTARWGLLPAWLVLALGLGATLSVWQMALGHVEVNQRQEFENRVHELRLRLDNRIEGYSQILRGAAGLFKASDAVSRKDWRRYVESFHLEKAYPAMQAVAFARHVDGAGLKTLTKSIRESGVPEFALRPEGARDAYVVNIYSEPFGGLNRKALGFDMWQEPVRRAAMEDALRRGEPAITEKITLKVDEPAHPVPAFIMYLPVRDVAGDTLYGFVLSPFRMPILVADLHTPATRGVALSIYDGVTTDAAALYHRDASLPEGFQPRYRHRETIDVGGRQWTLEFAATPGFGVEVVRHDEPGIVLGTGILISLLLSGLMWSAITLRRRAEDLARQMTRSLRESEARFRELFHQAPLGVWLLDRNGIIVDCNRVFLDYAGAEVDRVIGFNMFTDAQDGSFLAALRRTIDTGETVVTETAYTSTTGHRSAIYRYHFSPIRLGEGKDLILSFAEDITERRGAEQRHSRVVEASIDGFVLLDQNGRILQCNAALTQLSGYAQEELLALSVSDLDMVERSEDTARHIALIVAQGQDRFETRWRRKDGSLFEVEVTATYLSITGEIGVFVRDITLQKEHARELDRIAHYDALTGVPNRNLLADRMALAVARTRREETLMGVCYLDLDGFKPINDRYGHEVGDKLLVEIAERLKGCLRGSDTVARMGGDEFVLLLLGIQRSEECEAALRRILEAVARPVVIEGHSVAVSASLGVTLFPHDDADMDTLLRHADQSMYLAKQSGRNRYHIFDPERDRIARDRAERLARVAEGIAADEFILYYQPQVDMRAGRVTGAEALVRWRHPERGILPPAEFLAVIEDTDLIVELGDRIIGIALNQIRAWRAEGLDLRIGVNIAARHLQRTDFVDRLRQHLAGHPDVPPQSLELEVVESAALDDIQHVSKTITACKELGVGFALDDFGTGYSSLTYLKALPAQLLKIDQTFVRDMLTDAEDCAIVEGVIGLARVFHRNVIAEGVETVEHGHMLLQLGCDLAQGYGIARPMPAAGFPDWVRGWAPDPSWHDVRVAHRRHS